MPMKRALLTSTALAASFAFLAAPAMAAEKIQIGVGGYMEQWFGYAEGAGRNNQGFDQQSDVEIVFEGETTLDNGLSVGAIVTLLGQQDDDQMDVQFAYVEGSFGRVELGAADNAPYAQGIGVPTVGVELEDGDAPNWISGINGDLINTATNFTAEDDLNHKINYFTPRFQGFQLGVTYVPEALNDDNTGPNENDGVRDNAFGVSAHYENSFNDIDVAASVGYMHYGDDDALIGDEPESIGIGLSIGFAGFTVAGAYNNLDDSAVGDLETFGVGVTYETGPFGVSLGYIHGDDDASQAESDAFELGLAYGLGPGVSLHGSVYYVDQESAFGADLEGAAVVVGIAITF